MTPKIWIKQILIAIDQLFNALLYGWADETLSSRAWRKHKNNMFWYNLYILIEVIFFFEKNHCKSAYESEVHRKQLPIEYR